MSIRKILSNRRIVIAGIGAIALLSAAILGLTTAYFQDVETSVGNKFVAGDFDLMIDSQCSYNGQPQAFCTWLEKDLEGELFFNFGDVKPSDTGEDTVSFHIIDNDAWLCAEIGNLVNQDNGCRKPEQKVDLTCGNLGIGEGELQDNILFTVWKDTDCDNKLDPEIPGTPEIPPTDGYCDGPEPMCMDFMDPEICMIEGEPFGCEWFEGNPGTPGTPGQPAEQVLVQDKPAKAGYWVIADSTTGNPIPGDTTICYGVSRKVPLAVSNIIQSDSVVGNLTFSAVQSRGMTNFKCADLYIEICDDGIDNDYDGEIDEGCVVCGDGIIGGVEECDDANVNPGDGCGSSCYIEPGWQCAGEPSVCTPLGETICDDLIDNDGDTLIDCGDPDCTNDPVCQSECGDGICDPNENSENCADDCPAYNVWINEIHYDNVGADINDGVEVAGPAGTDLTGWSVVFYNGSGGAVYYTLNLSGTIDNEQSGFGALWFAVGMGLQNGEPDGLALVAPDGVTVIQFLSYEGSFVASNGPAIGMMSIDIGVFEDPALVPPGESLQLQGSGNKYADFIWAWPIAHTSGARNTGQTFVPSP
jgi:predicted ribosomally synthesized peptide with SipW-like signal peptide